MQAPKWVHRTIIGVVVGYCVHALLWLTGLCAALIKLWIKWGD